MNSIMPDSGRELRSLRNTDGSYSLADVKVLGTIDASEVVEALVPPDALLSYLRSRLLLSDRLAA